MERRKIYLTEDQRFELTLFTETGTHTAKAIRRARIVLLLDESEGKKAEKQEDIARLLGITRQSIIRIKEDFLNAENIMDFLQRKRRATPPIAPKITGEIEAKIIALACSDVPKGFSRWTLRMLADKAVELMFIDSISNVSVHSILKKHNLSLT
jgi:hypothetical protein